MGNRLAAAHPDKLIFCLDPVICPCSTCTASIPPYLAWVLEALVDGDVVNEIVCPTPWSVGPRPRSIATGAPAGPPPRRAR